MHGTSHPTVGFINGLAFYEGLFANKSVGICLLTGPYGGPTRSTRHTWSPTVPNALRYNGKKAVLLAYPNEGHHLAGLANQRDLTVRFMEFFDHYLKGAKAPAWLTEGVPYLKKDEKKEPPKEPAK
jgi:hypothetical protein